MLIGKNFALYSEDQIKCVHIQCAISEICTNSRRRYTWLPLIHRLQCVTQRPLRTLWVSSVQRNNTYSSYQHESTNASFSSHGPATLLRDQPSFVLSLPFADEAGFNRNGIIKPCLKLRDSGQIIKDANS